MPLAETSPRGRGVPFAPRRRASAWEGVRSAPRRRVLRVEGSAPRLPGDASPARGAAPLGPRTRVPRPRRRASPSRGRPFARGGVHPAPPSPRILIERPHASPPRPRARLRPPVLCGRVQVVLRPEDHAHRRHPQGHDPRVLEGRARGREQGRRGGVARDRVERPHEGGRPEGADRRRPERDGAGRGRHRPRRWA